MKHVAVTTVVFVLLALSAAAALPRPVLADGRPMFYANYEGGFYRSTTPFHIIDPDYIYTQALAQDGRVVSNITISKSYAEYGDLGFGYYSGAFAALWNTTIDGSGTFYANVWFDASGNGAIFDWAAGPYPQEMAGLGGDTYALGPGMVGEPDPGSSPGAIELNGSSPFWMMSPCDGRYSLTMDQILSMCPWAKPTTRVEVWVGITALGAGRVNTTDGYYYGAAVQSNYVPGGGPQPTRPTVPNGTVSLWPATAGGAALALFGLYGFTHMVRVDTPRLRKWLLAAGAASAFAWAFLTYT